LWKSRVSLFLEDTLQSQKEHKETFLHLIKETALFKVELELTEDLQRRLEFVEWHDRVEVIHTAIVAGGWIELGKLEVVVQEGTTKGFAGVQMDEVLKVVWLFKAAEGLQKLVKDTLQGLESGKEVKELSILIEINDQVQEMRVRIEEVKELVKVIEEAQGFVTITDEYLTNWSILTEGSDKF
jgi:PLU-1-like protein